ncbi:hypothetical protein QYE76_009157 [Lolium multiflorum]|uniref:Integrase catalytic domain-containing protein n=1 Tax=Lolium multiflorum TaxID=4521 RepID=A0AAD8TUQ1_LOLMU|nr:hypothetical protein QYE76_009157 [Lolium multiflorum]
MPPTPPPVPQALADDAPQAAQEAAWSADLVADEAYEQQEHDLQQGNSTVDEFYTQSAAIWRQLDSLRSNGTLAQFSCPGTHAQNGVAERKHRHLLETARAMMIDASLPPHFWAEAEAVSISTYLINLQPSTALQGGIPLERLTGRAPNYSTLRLFVVFAMFFLLHANAPS